MDIMGLSGNIIILSNSERLRVRERHDSTAVADEQGKVRGFAPMTDAQDEGDLVT